MSRSDVQWICGCVIGLTALCTYFLAWDVVFDLEPSAGTRLVALALFFGPAVIAAAILAILSRKNEAAE